MACHRSAVLDAAAAGPVISSLPVLRRSHVLHGGGDGVVTAAAAAALSGTALQEPLLQDLLTGEQ